MMPIPGFAAGGCAICWLGIIIQMKPFDRTIGKLRSDLEMGKVIL